MGTLTCSLAHGVLVDVISRLPILPTNISKEDKGSAQKLRKLVTQKTFTSNEKRRCREG